MSVLSFSSFSLTILSKFFLDEHLMFYTLGKKKKEKQFVDMKREPVRFQRTNNPE